MRSSFACSFFALVVAACGGSTLDVAPGSSDGGNDATSGDASLDSGGGGDTRGDITPGGDSTADTTPTGDTPPPPDDTTPPPADTRPDVVGDSGGGPCSAGGTCSPVLTCCSGSCVYETNDPLNCGGCGIVCSGETTMCLGGHCAKPTCEPACGDGQSCCQVDGPGPSGPPRCVDGPTCPIGCPLCG